MTKKAKTSKKTTAKKATKARSKTGSTAKRTKLLKELQTLIKQLPDEGISVLLKQTQVILHNIKVEKEYLENKEKRAKQLKKAETKKATIEVKEGTDNSYFIITMNNYPKTFVLDEMKRMVKICHTAGNEPEAARRLYNWFAHYRQDVIHDVISAPNSMILNALYSFIMRTYTTK